MNIEEKAKAYDEALEKAKKYMNDGYTVLMPDLFPQLRESEDEQIRRRLIEFISDIKKISENGRTSWAVRKKDAEMCNTFLSYLENQKEQKPAEWSKNDTAFLNEIIDFFENKTGRLQHDLDMYAHWLKSLPERFNLQPKQEQNDYITPHKEFFKFIYDRLINVHKENPNVDYMRSFKERLNNLSFEEKQEWSKEDEENLELVTDCVYNFYPDPVMKYKLKDWLKSLRPQPHWKPSEEQKEPEYYQHFDPDC